MKTGLLLLFAILLTVLPWVMTAFSPGVTGMYEDPRHVLFQGDSDVYDCIWHWRWIDDCIAGGNDPRVYHGNTLGWNNMGWPDLFLAGLFDWGYEFSLFLGSVFTAVAGYFLARSWGIGRNGSIIAAFIITWMPVRLIRIYQHYPVASLGYALGALAAVNHSLRKPGAGGPILAFVLSALAVAESFQHGITIAAGWLLTVSFNRWKGLGRTALSGLYPALGCMVGALWMLTSPGLSGTDPGMDWKESVFWGAEVQSYFLPSLAGTPIVADYMPNPFEGVVSPGFTVLVLAVLWSAQKRKWLPAAAAFVIMVVSMGPLLKFLGIPTPVPLPYMIPAKLPLLSAARAPARLGMISGIMAALAAGAFAERLKGRSAVIVPVLVVLEILPLRLETIRDNVPSFYLEETADTLRLEIPASEDIRLYSLLEAADGVPRRVKFFARGGEQMMEGIPEGLRWEPAEAPAREDLSLTGAQTVIYNRWMFPADVRERYDSIYSGIFLPCEKNDSLWVWRSNEDGA